MSITVRVTLVSGNQSRKKPKAGDERYLKGRGVTQIRQQRIVDDPLYGRCHLVSNGRPVWEWVDKGGDEDRTSEAYKEKRKSLIGETNANA